MFGEQADPGVLVAMLAVNVLLTYYVYRAVSREFGGDGAAPLGSEAGTDHGTTADPSAHGDATDPRIDADSTDGVDGTDHADGTDRADSTDRVDRTDRTDRHAGVVECPDCGATNETGYRFCRDCVAELPEAMDFGSGPGGPFGRAM